MSPTERPAWPTREGNGEPASDPSGSGAGRVARRSAGRQRLGAGRLIARSLGELMMTTGALLLLFVVWQLFWTDVLASATQTEEREAIVADFAPDPERSQQFSSGPIPVDEEVPEYEEGAGFAIAHLPSIDLEVPILEGVELSILDLGVLGHYPGTAMPGQVGNFALAGHRTTWGRPLHDLGEMQPGEPVVIEMAEGWFVYTFERQRVVLPNQTEVIAPVPDEVGEEPTEAWLVLTACHPKYSAAERLIGYASYDRFVPRDDGLPEELEGAG